MKDNQLHYLRHDEMAPAFAIAAVPVPVAMTRDSSEESQPDPAVLMEVKHWSFWGNERQIAMLPRLPPPWQTEIINDPFHYKKVTTVVWPKPEQVCTPTRYTKYDSPTSN